MTAKDTNKKPNNKPNKKLSIKEKKFVANRVAGKTQLAAAKAAGYLPTGSDASIKREAVNIEKRPHIQKAIEEALTRQGMTPEWAVAQLGKVAEQDEEMGAKRLASMNILELYGWSKQERPNVHVEFKGNFFNSARDTSRREPMEGTIIDGEE